jgi:hypothetical protein
VSVGSDQDLARGLGRCEVQAGRLSTFRVADNDDARILTGTFLKSFSGAVV